MSGPRKPSRPGLDPETAEHLPLVRPTGGFVLVLLTVPVLLASLLLVFNVTARRPLFWPFF